MQKWNGGLRPGSWTGLLEIHLVDHRLSASLTVVRGERLRGDRGGTRSARLNSRRSILTPGKITTSPGAWRIDGGTAIALSMGNSSTVDITLPLAGSLRGRSA
jgi:hypothetical protein